MAGLKTATERLGLSFGVYITIEAAAQKLRIGYPQAQRTLRDEFLQGNLERAQVGRRLIYTSKQRGLF